MTDPIADDTNNFANDTNDIDVNTGDPADMGLEEAEELSARARTQRRLTQARAAVSDATLRAGRVATPSTREHTENTEDSEPSTMSTVIEHVRAYRTYLVGAVAAMLAVLAVARRRRSLGPQIDDSVDLGVWHLHADVPAEQT